MRKQQVRLDDVEALKVRDVYETLHRQCKLFSYESNELAKSMLHDMWEKRSGFLYPLNIQSDTDRTQYLIALEKKRSELHIKCEAADANRLKAHLAREEEGG
jgi:hypothetical protein